MLYDFTFVNKTKIYFGKNSLNYLNDELKKYGKNILLVYGKGAIKKIGLYDEVISILKKHHNNVFELSNISPNPRYKEVLKGKRLVLAHNIDLILAVGGGSVIDCSKAISVVSYAKGNAFRKYWIENKKVNHKLVPVASILTMVGTGSEANAGSVITNTTLKLKKGRVFDEDVNPRFSILNPLYTYSVSKYQMASGIFDCMSHLLEEYFSGTDNNVSDYLLEGLMLSLIDNAKVAMVNPKDYEALLATCYCFQKDYAPSKIQFGAAWWFLDHRDGMERQFKALSNFGLFGHFIGMLTDSRSFLSYARHEYFRRVLCSYVGDIVEKGEFPNDKELLENMIKNICYGNAKKYFNR